MLVAMFVFIASECETGLTSVSMLVFSRENHKTDYSYLVPRDNVLWVPEPHVVRALRFCGRHHVFFYSPFCGLLEQLFYEFKNSRV